MSSQSVGTYVTDSTNAGRLNKPRELPSSTKDLRTSGFNMAKQLIKVELCSEEN